MKTATKFLSMLLLVAMCLSLMGGSAYASGLAPLSDPASSNGLATLADETGSGSEPSTGGINGIYGLTGTEGDSTDSGDDMGADLQNQTVFGLSDSVVAYSNPVCNWIIGSKVYETLSEALNNVSAGGTITVNANVALDSSVTISKNVTIDLEGYTLTLGGNQLYVASGATLNLQNGTVINGTNAIANVDGYLNLYSLTADSATFSGSATSSSNPCRIQIYNGCNFSGSKPDSKYMAPGFSTDENGNTSVHVARIGNVYYNDAVAAINAAKSGETVTFITDTSVAKEVNARGAVIDNKNITLDLGANLLNMDGNTINNANVSVTGTNGGALSGAITMNNANVALGSGTDAGNFVINGGSLTVNGGDIGTVNVKNGTLNMASGTIATVRVGSGTLNVSGGTVNEFIADAGYAATRSICGGQWTVNDVHLAAFDAFIKDNYVRSGSNPYTVSNGSDVVVNGEFKSRVVGSPYTRNSNGSVYVELSVQSTNGYWIATDYNANGATKISTSNYDVSNNVNGQYNYRLTFTNSYLNSLANGTYYLFAVYNGITQRMGYFTVQGNGTPIIPGTASVWPVDDTWYSGTGMFYFYVTPDLQLVDGVQYDYYDVVIDGMQIGGDKISYNGYQKFGIAASVMDTLATGYHKIEVRTTAGWATGSFRVGATLRAVDTDKHVTGSSRNLQFVCSDSISRVWVGNNELTSYNYSDYWTLSSSGKTVTLTPKFLNSQLVAGNTYTITVQTANGDRPSCNFQILTTAQASSSPRTGDESNLALWAALLVLAGGATVAILPRLKKHEN